MPRVKKTWSHKRYGKGWTGIYSYTDGVKERVFLLVKKDRNTKAFGSPITAKEHGWKQS